MATAQDICIEALRLIAVYAPGETPTDADLEQCLTCLNDMLDSWSNESLSCFATLEQSGTVVAGKSSYTIGAGGDFNMTRPLRLTEGPGAAYSQDTQGNNYYIKVIPRSEWNLIGNRSNLMSSNFVQVLFYDSQFPLGVINVWPQPNTGSTMFWDSYLQLTEFASLSTSVSLPPGYKKALQDNLSLTIWSYFKPMGSEPPASLIRMAATSKGNVKRTNQRTVRAVYDPELVSRAKGTYNPYTDGYGTRS